jgi:hypothetical protein
LESDAGITNNEGMGTPFAGNIEVYPLYRMKRSGALEEVARPEVRMTKLPTIIRGVLFLPEASGEKREARCELLDVSGRRVLDLKPGANDVSRLSPGVYFVHEEPQASSLKPQVSSSPEGRRRALAAEPAAPLDRWPWSG